MISIKRNHWQIIMGLITMMISVTVYALTTFATKSELHDQSSSIKELIDVRLDGLEKKLDRIDDRLSNQK